MSDRGLSRHEAVIELRALDVAGGRAIVRIEDRWYLMARDREWQPIDIGGQERTHAWLLSSPMLSVYRTYENFADVLTAVRSVCAAGATSRETVERMLDGAGEPDPEAHRWEERFPEVIRRCGGLVDRFFESRGCSAEESFRLSLRVFQQLYMKGPTAGEEVLLMLCQLALEARQDRSREEKPAGLMPEVDSYPIPLQGTHTLAVARLRRLLPSLERRTARCLYLWVVPQHSHEEVAKLMRLSVDDVRERLLAAAHRLDRAVERLRDPEVVQACLATFRWQA